MSFHPQKCYTVSATRKKDKVVPSYHLHGHNLQNVSTAKYLGVNIQDNLNWGLHIDTITNKANKTLGFLRRKLKNAVQQDGLQINTTRHPASTPSSTLLPGSHYNNAVKKLDFKYFTNFTTTSSPLILNTYHSQQKPDQATERPLYTAPTSPIAGHSTDRCHSSPGPSPKGTACPRKQWQPCPWTVSSRGLPVTRPPLPFPIPSYFLCLLPPSTMPLTLSLHFRSVYCNLHKSA